MCDTHFASMSVFDFRVSLNINSTAYWPFNHLTLTPLKRGYLPSKIKKRKCKMFRKLLSYTNTPYEEDKRDEMAHIKFTGSVVTVKLQI